MVFKDKADYFSVINESRVVELSKKEKAVEKLIESINELLEERDILKEDIANKSTLIAADSILNRSMVDVIKNFIDDSNNKEEEKVKRVRITCLAKD